MIKSTTGVYKIQSPDGVVYVGSSVNIHNRILRHKNHLRKNIHYAKTLQQRWNEGQQGFVFEVLEECSASMLIERERFWAGCFERLHNTYAQIPEKNVPVDCSNGKKYESFCDAAKEFGVRPSFIKHLADTQRQGKLGVRFKLASDDWREVLSHYDQIKATRLKNGGYQFTEETRQKMRDAKVGFVPPNKGGHHTEASKRKMAESQLRVIVRDALTGINYESTIRASREAGISRTQVRRLMARGERFLRVDSVQPKGKRK